MIDFGTFPFLTRQSGGWHPKPQSNSRLMFNDKGDTILPRGTVPPVSGDPRIEGGGQGRGRGRGPAFSAVCPLRWGRGPAASCFSSLSAPSQSQPSYSAPALTDLLSTLKYPRSCPRPLLGNTMQPSLNTTTPLSHTPHHLIHQQQVLLTLPSKIFPECDQVPHHYGHAPDPSHQLTVSAITS